MTYLASAGDDGYGMQDPADFDTVVSVGGTILKQSASGAYSEIVWPDTGGGCSVVPKPTWQKDPDCTYRTGNDVAAVAFWAAEYDTYEEEGWITVRGTSVASPLTAGVFGLAGNAKRQYGAENIWNLAARDPKKLAKELHTNITGTDEGCPASFSGTYICQTGTNGFGTYSSPTGWGSPNGIAAF